MTFVYGLIALALVSILYLFVSSGGPLWPGGPQLQPDAARNLSIALILVAVLLCGVMFGSAAQSIASVADQGRATQAAQLTATARVAPPGLNAEETARAQATRSVGIVTQTPVTLQPSTLRTQTPTTIEPPAPLIATTPAAEASASAAPSPSATPGRPSATPTLEPSSTATPSPMPQPTQTPSSTSTPTATPAALPLDPRELIDTVLSTLIRRANDLEVEAILSGDESRVNPLWTGQAREVVLNNVRRVRSRFVDVLDVTWTAADDGIRLLSSTVVTATYTTSEVWTFIGTVGQTCPNGSPAIRRYVETYPAEQYLLKLESGMYSVDQWRLGPIIVSEQSTDCPAG